MDLEDWARAQGNNWKCVTSNKDSRNINTASYVGDNAHYCMIWKGKHLVVNSEYMSSSQSHTIGVLPGWVWKKIQFNYLIYLGGHIFEKLNSLRFPGILKTFSQQLEREKFA